MIRSILRVEKRSMINYFRALSDSKKVIYGLVSAVIALFIVPSVISVLSLFIFNAPDEHLSGFILLASAAAVLILALLAVNSIIKEMFMDRNIQLYLTFPISPSSLFMAKFLKQWLTNTVSIMAPLGLAFGVLFALKEGQWFLTVTHLVYFLLLSILSMAVAYGLVFLVTKILPANKVSEVLTFLGGISFVLVYAVLIVGSSSIEDILVMLPDAAFIYDGFLYNLNFAGGLTSIAVSIVTGAVLVMGLRSFVVHAFKSGWVGEQGAKREKKNASSAASTPLKILMLKDFKLTLRDFKEWAVLLPQYLLPGVMIFFMYTNSAAGPESGSVNMYDAQMIAVSISGTIIISLYAGAYNTARDAGHFEFLKTLPIKSADIVKAKYLYNILTITPVYLAAGLIVWLVLPISMTALLYSMVFIILVSLAMVPAGMLAGSTQPVVSTKNPTKRLDTATNIILSFVMVVFLLTAGLISLLFMGGGGEINFFIINIVLAVLAAAAGASVLFLKNVEKRYDKGFNITYKD